MDDSDGMHVDGMDPGSISLFSTNIADVPQTSLAVNEDGPRQADLPDIVGRQTQQAKDAEMSYSKYMKKKVANVESRRNFVERIEKLKNTRGLSFVIPQFKQATSNQLAIFLRRFRRSADANSLISTEMLERMFENEGQAMPFKLESTIPKWNINNIGKTYYPTNNFVPAAGEDKRIASKVVQQPQPSDEEATEAESSDYEEDELFGSKSKPSAEMYDLLEQRAQIQVADAQAKRMQKEIAINRLWAESMLANSQEEFTFEMPEKLNTAEEGEKEEEEEDSTMTCARCRPVLVKPERRADELIRHDFNRKLKSSVRPIASYKRCGTEQYAFVDESIHPFLSLPTAIPMDSQLQKYLHMISFIPREDEIRRYKVAQLISETTDKDMRSEFYNLEDLHKSGAEDHFGSSDGTKGIKISLGPLRKTLKKADTEEGSGSDFDHSSALIKKRRRMTIDQPSKKFKNSKSSKLESRRCSHAAEFGSSMFDYDSQLMDIGLPMPAIQKVENVEIAIPSYRRKIPMVDLPAGADCQRCQSLADQWTEIRRLHGDLESQERQQRFRPNTGSAATRKLTGSQENTSFVGAH